MIDLTLIPRDLVNGEAIPDALVPLFFEWATQRYPRGTLIDEAMWREFVAWCDTQGAD